jgi:hypothetical protein
MLVALANRSKQETVESHAFQTTNNKRSNAFSLLPARLCDAVEALEEMLEVGLMLDNREVKIVGIGDGRFLDGVKWKKSALGERERTDIIDHAIAAACYRYR